MKSFFYECDEMGHGAERSDWTTLLYYAVHDVALLPTVHSTSCNIMHHVAQVLKLIILASSIIIFYSYVPTNEDVAC